MQLHNTSPCLALLGFGCFLVTSQATTGRASEPPRVVAKWDFDTEESTPLAAHRGVHRDQPGPRPAEFPNFDPENRAVKLDGDGAYLSLADPGPQSEYDFTDGDAITLQAWVNLESIGSGENVYIIGKGRTGAKQFERDNQNWALRMREVDGLARVSFLFATEREPSAAKRAAHWHRWTSSHGFVAGSGWHRVAVSYRFGTPDSMRCWIDDQPRDGSWDMGGPTEQPPVSDDDAVWIGSSLGGSPASSFHGWLDEIAVHRGIVPDEVMRAVYRRDGPPRDDSGAMETVPEVDTVPGRVHVTYHEGFAAHNRWPAPHESLQPPVTHWEAGEFLLPRLPRRYDAWGIRDSWQPTVLVRAAAEVSLAEGRHRFLLRARGLSRLWVDETVVARTEPHGGSTDGHQPVDPLPEPPLPGLRIVGYGDQETFGEIEIAEAGTYRVILEALVGGKKLRAEPGEMLVAVQTADGRSFELLRGAGETAPPRMLTDEDVEAAVQQSEGQLTALDDRNRREASSSQDAFWQRRHQLAKDWLAEHPAPDVPRSEEAAEQHPIDAFLATKIRRAAAASSGKAGAEAAHFHKAVLPILTDNCFRCHGEKERGGLRLHDRDAVLQGGDSGDPAVVPHDPEASQLVWRIRSTDESDRMPPSAELPADQVATLERWIEEGAVWPAPPAAPEELATPAVIDDAAFLRRVFLDTVGIPPGEEDIRRFLADTAPDKRAQTVDRLLEDDRFADHWVSYWQDVLAENPNPLKPTLNNTGPFRWFLYESLRDNRPFDRLVTELLMMRGSEREGGSAGFGLATDNDAALASKGHILASAFLGIEMQCARCHDSPYHSTTQRDLFSLAAMLSRKNVTVPLSSTVSPGFFAEDKGRESLIRVTLNPGEPVAPQWPFEEITGTLDDEELATLLRQPEDSREQLAALITAPSNERFAKVLVNRLWKRLIGAGFVEPVDDWEGQVASHPELLEWLSREFVGAGYDVKHLVRLILTSETYQRAATGDNSQSAPEKRFFAAPDRRRLTAEQVVDSLYAASGRTMQVEELTFDPEARRPAGTMISLGFPSRAWMFATLSNERDRPSLSLPRAQAVTDVLEAFGWTASRQSPRSTRDDEPSALQPGVLANSLMVTWITRASAGSELAQLAVDSTSAEALVDSVFLRFLGRLPADEERAVYAQPLAEGFDQRLLPLDQVPQPEPPPRLRRISWSNHLAPEANLVKLEMERQARRGDPADPRLRESWRKLYEDVVWAAINSPEFVWIP